MEQFIENFYAILENTDRTALTPETEFKQLEEWDSMTALMTIAMIDEQYGKKITGTDIKDCNTLSDLYNKVSN